MSPLFIEGGKIKLMIKTEQHTLNYRFMKGITMKAQYNKRKGGYSAELANNILDRSKAIHSLSETLEPQMKFEDGKRTDEVIAYKGWFSQSGLPPFEVKFTDQVKLPPYLSIITFDYLQACEVNYNIYFKADGINEVK